MPKTAKKETSLIRFKSIKKYIIDNLKMKSSNNSIDNLIESLTKVTYNIVKEAGASAKEDKRNTIMEKDIQKALEKHLEKGDLSWQETAQEIIKKNPTQLSNITKAINEHIQ